MGSVVTGAMDALVERVRRRPEGVAGPAGHPDPCGPPAGSRSHPLGGRNDLMVAVAPWVRKPLL
jgi:hypothetical protein